MKNLSVCKGLCIYYAFLPSITHRMTDSEEEKMTRDEMFTCVGLIVCVTLFLLHLLLTYTQACHWAWDWTHPLWTAVSLVSFNFRRSWIDIDLLPTHDTLPNGKHPGANSTSVCVSFWSLTIFAQQSYKAILLFTELHIWVCVLPTNTESYRYDEIL